MVGRILHTLHFDFIFIQYGTSSFQLMRRPTEQLTGGGMFLPLQ